MPALSDLPKPRIQDKFNHLIDPCFCHTHGLLAHDGVPSLIGHLVKFCTINQGRIKVQSGALRAPVCPHWYGSTIAPGQCLENVWICGIRNCTALTALSVAPLCHLAKVAMKVHPAMPCLPTPHPATPHPATLCPALPHYTLLYHTLPYCTLPCCTLPHRTLKHCTLPYCTMPALYYATRCCIIHTCCTIQQSLTPFQDGPPQREF